MVCALQTAILLIAGLIGPAQSAAASSGLISMTAFAFDERTGELQNLSIADVEVRGIAARPTAVERLKGPRRVVFLLDLSACIRLTPAHWVNAMDTLTEFIRQYGGEDSLALHVFAEKHSVLVPFGQDPIEIQKQVSLLRLTPVETISREYGSQTEITRAVQSSLNETKAELKLGDALVLVSDGEFPAVNARALEQIQMELCARGVRLCILRTTDTVQGRMTAPGAPGSMTRDLNSISFQGYLANQKMLVFPVGGIVLSPGSSDRKFDPGRIASASRTLASFIRNAWRVELQNQEALPKPRRIVLQYRSPEGARANKIQILHPQWVLPDGFIAY
jgi:hypothetical protein